jgi:CheY-like chemotaxis protein
LAEPHAASQRSTTGAYVFFETQNLLSKECSNTLGIRAMTKSAGTAGGGLPQGREASFQHTILVVEDDEEVRSVLAEQLRDAGYTVVEAADCHEAWQALARRSDVSLLLSDVDLPGSIDGLSFARTIRSEHPSLKVVLTSGRLPKIDGTDHHGFFQKPCSPAKIIDHIRALLK